MQRVMWNSVRGRRAGGPSFEGTELELSRRMRQGAMQISGEADF